MEFINSIKAFIYVFKRKMCGIIGRIGINENSIKTLRILKDLEYRGYDSYGILFNLNGNLKIFKDTGEINLNEIKEKNIKSNIELGHTRWATHGGVSKDNAHPHSDSSNLFNIVMNGIVENADEIRRELESVGVEFKSQTDTEVIVHLFSKYFDLSSEDYFNEVVRVIQKIKVKLKGEFSFLISFLDFIVAYKNINPIVCGFSQTDEILLCSDLNLLMSNSFKYCIMDDEDILVCKIENSQIKYQFYNGNFQKIDKSFLNCKNNNEEKGKTTKYFMEKEILEQKYLVKISTSKNIDSVNYLIDELKNGRNLVISAAGSSYHAGLFLHYTLLKYGIMSSVILASELKNYLDVIKDDSLVVVFSQSGETADLIYPLRELNSKAEIFAVTNTPNSTIDRFSKKSFYLNCGREVAVASTKAFAFQVQFSNILFCKLDEKIFDYNEYERLFEENFLNLSNKIKEICSLFSKSKDFFFIGRGDYYPLALEGALKLKEISYIHAEGFAGGELKHGSLALIEENVPCVVLGQDLDIISNAVEIKTRGGKIIGINDKYNNSYDYFIEIPSKFQELFSTFALQLLAFEMSILLGNNPDKPRNLAKSVTVK